MLSSQKAPSAEMRDYFDTLRQKRVVSVLLKLSGARSSQELTMRQAENLGKRLLRLVKEQTVREVLES